MGKKGSNPPPPPRQCRPAPPPPPPSKRLPGGSVINCDRRYKESIVPLQPRSITRPYATPERKAYLFMIDNAINLGWCWYCSHMEVNIIWNENFMHDIDFCLHEDMVMELARAYARENNIMLGEEVLINQGGVPWWVLSEMASIDFKKKEAEALSNLRLVTVKKPAPTPRPSPGMRVHHPDIFDWFSNLFKKKPAKEENCEGYEGWTDGEGKII